MNVLQVENLIRSYRKSVIKESEEDVKVLKGISFQVVEGEFVGIMGKSGCGKTTLLKTLGMIDKPTDGTIKFMGEDTSELYGDKLADIRNSKIGFIFQDFNLLDTLTGFENIALALTIMKVPAKEIGQRVQKVAELLNITDVLSKHPYQMSGGQRQRVASARAIVTNPSIILADEPTGALDSKSARMLLESFRKLNDEIQATILMVTHDAFTASYCKRILFIKDGKLFNELIRGMESRKEFFDRIMEVIALLGGDLNAE